MRISSKGFAFSLFIGVLLVGMFGTAASAAMGDVTEYPIPTPNSQPDQIAEGPDGNLWFTQFGGGANQIAVMDTDGNVLDEFTVPTPNSGPRGITAGPGNFMYFTEWTANKIGRINVTNGQITEFPIPTANSQPLGITLGPDGNIWFAESAGNKIGKLIPGSGAITEFAVPAPNSQPTGIVSAPDGRLWFTLANLNVVAKSTTAGVITLGCSPTSPGAGITIANGFAWFAEPLADRVAVCNMAGAIVELGADAGSNPIGVATGPSGNDNVWVTQPGHNEIRQINSITGVTVADYPVPTAASIVTGISPGPDDNMWFTEYGTNQIGTIESGADLTVTSSAGPFTNTPGAGAVTTAVPVGSPVMNCAAAQLPTGNVCTSRYQPPSVITLTATPNAGTYFVAWISGDCALSFVNTCMLTMDQDRATEAEFWKAWNVNVTTTGISGGSGTVSGTTGTPAPLVGGMPIAGCQTMPAAMGTCTSDYFAGESTPSSLDVTLVPTPAAGSIFTGWTGDCTGTGACVLSIDQARNVNAEFTTAWDLTVTKTSVMGGTGTVTSNPIGIDCGLTCVATYTHGTIVTLTPTPDAGSRFGGWAGDCAGMGACNVTMDMARAVDATFVKQYLLTITKSGTGGGTVIDLVPGGNIDCGATCSAMIDAGTVVWLSATPDGTSTFTGWGAPCSGDGLCAFALTADTTVNADFARVTHVLSVIKTGAGSGTVVSSPSGIDCGVSCSHAFATGTMVSLSATPTPTSVFTGWSGEGCSGTGTCDVVLGVDRNVVANFDGITPFEQADNLIRLHQGGSFVGQNIYNLDGTDQRAAGTAEVGKTVVYDVKIENDGTGIDQFTVFGPGNAPGVKITYSDGSGNITAPVTAGTYTTPEIDPVLGPDTGRPNNWVIKVRMKGTVEGVYKALVTSRSVADPSDSAADAVKSKLKATT